MKSMITERSKTDTSSGFLHHEIADSLDYFVWESTTSNKLFVYPLWSTSSDEIKEAEQSS